MSGVQFHFLNVGAGDCTMIYFPARERTDGKKMNERIMLIDSNNHDNHEEYENIIQYYKATFGNKNIFRFISTHPHQDHIKGINKLFNDRGISIINFWCVNNNFKPEEFNDEEHELDWNDYVKAKTGKHSFKLLNYTADDNPCIYWSDDEDRITILSPSQEMIVDAHLNKQDNKVREPHNVLIDYISYALLIKVNSIKIILAGDGKEDAWKEINKKFDLEIKNCDILKAAHHGHESGFHEEAVKAIDPKYIIFSNSEEEDKNHGAENLYSKACPDATILKTCDYGTIIADCKFDGTITLTDKYGKQL